MQLPLDAETPPPRGRPPPDVCHVTCDACWEANPSPLDRQMPMKILPCPKLRFAGSKNVPLSFKQLQTVLHCLYMYRLISPQAATESASKGATTTEITGLSPGVSYTVRITTTSNNQFSEVKELSVETYKY